MKHLVLTFALSRAYTNKQKIAKEFRNKIQETNKRRKFLVHLV